MPMCQDKAAKELSSKGYSLVRYPRSNILPLDIIAGERSPLAWIGPISDVWRSTERLPTIQNGKVPRFDTERTEDFKGSLGIKILQGLVSTFTGGASADISVSSTVSFTYDAPQQSFVPITELGRYLKAGDLDSSNPVIKRYLASEEGVDSHFYLITEVLRSRKLIVRLSGSNSEKVAADARALNEVAGLRVETSNLNSTSSQVTFDGDVDLTFAFRAFELQFAGGAWIVVGAAMDNTFLSGSLSVQQPSPFGATPVRLLGAS